MSVLIDLLGLVPNTSAIIRLKLVIVGIGAMAAGCVVMGMEGFLLQGCGIAACGVALTVIAVSRQGSTASDIRGRVTPPHENTRIEPTRLSSCEHLWVEQDEALNLDPMILRCSKCGETIWV
jgi:hypothetical protein